MTKEETLLVLRAYQVHPTSWSEVLEEVKSNTQHLSSDARLLYDTASQKQLKDRMSSKFGKLLSVDTSSIKDVEIRTEAENIKAAERRLVERSDHRARPEPDRRQSVVDDLPYESDNDLDQQTQQPVARIPGDNAQQNDQQPGPAPVHRPTSASGDIRDYGRQRRRKRSLASIIRENQLAYNKFITKKVPKVLRELGISSSDDDYMSIQ